MAQTDHVEQRSAVFSSPGRTPAERWRTGESPGFLPGPPPLTRFGNDNQRHLLDHGPADELTCLQGVLAPQLLCAAETRARELGIGADQVLIRWDVLDEASYLQHLSRHTGIAIHHLSDVDRRDSLLRDDQIHCAAASGIVPLRKDGRLILAVAPRNLTARAICRADPSIGNDIRLTPDAALQQFLLRHGGPALTDAATGGLHNRFPALSAASDATTSGRWRSRLKRACAVSAVALLPPYVMPELWTTAMALWFLGFVALRLISSFWPRRQRTTLPPPSDDRLPAYTIVAALYREASSVAPLLRALDALDYPREKLDIILVVEPDDLQTRAAIARLGRKPHLRTLIAPPVAPQTKPKALNWALPFVRGSLVAVFDAEDRPEPGQLRAAVDAFRRHGDDVACAQASLCIDNETHTWLSRTFAAEYAGQFDVYLPGMSAMGLPLPLGGSSNHFRTAILREIGGWDAFNVTEDADLGIRLARFGYRSVTFASTTFEEAPVHFRSWLRQRTRWMKGWLQTWCVHMRQPRQLWRDAGARGFVTLNLVAGGNVLTALAYPVMLGALLAHLLAGDLAAPSSWSLSNRPALLYLVAICAGCLSTAIVGLLGLARRNRLRDGWILLLTSFYWVCLSVAAWRAVIHYVWNPHHWEKTEHGLAARAGDPPRHGSGRRGNVQLTDSA